MQVYDPSWWRWRCLVDAWSLPPSVSLSFLLPFNSKLRVRAKREKKHAFFLVAIFATVISVCFALAAAAVFSNTLVCVIVFGPMCDTSQLRQRNIWLLLTTVENIECFNETMDVMDGGWGFHSQRAISGWLCNAVWGKYAVGWLLLQGGYEREKTEWENLQP